MSSHHHACVLSLFAVMVFWGSAFASSKVAVNAVGHEVAAPLRFVLGAVVLLLVLPFVGGNGPRPTGRDWRALAGLGALGVFGFNMLLFWGLSMAPAADGSIIVPVLSPLITTTVRALLDRKRPTIVLIAGLGTALLGAVVFLAGAPTSSGGSSRLAGDAVFVAAAACWSAYTICGGPVLRRLPTHRVTAYSTTVGALALAVVALPSAGRVAWSSLDAGFWLNQAYVAIFPTALGYVLYYGAVRRLGATTAATMMFLVPVTGLACSVVFLGESISMVQLTGSALMLAGAFLATRRPTAPAGGAPVTATETGGLETPTTATDGTQAR